MMTHNSPEVKALESKILAFACLADLDSLETLSKTALLALALAELPLLIAEMERPTPEGMEARHNDAVRLASRILQRVHADKGAAQ